MASGGLRPICLRHPMQQRKASVYSRPVAISGERMAKRKTGPRHPCGKLKQPSAKDRALKDAELYRANMAQVASQPHRRDFADPISPRLECALGRFCERQRLRSELFDAGREYADLLRRWRVAKGCPDPVHTGGMGSGQGPSDAVVASWWKQIERIEAGLRRESFLPFLAVRHLAIDDRDIPATATAHAVEGLCIVAQELGRLPVGAHPFVRAAA